MLAPLLFLKFIRTGLTTETVLNKAHLPNNRCPSRNKDFADRILDHLVSLHGIPTLFPLSSPIDVSQEEN